MSERQKETSSTYEATFFIVPTYIANLPGLTLPYLRVYEAIFQFWNKGRSCYLSNPVFMKRCNIGKTHLQDAFAYFEEHGEIIRSYKGGKRHFLQPQRSVEIDLDSTEKELHTDPAVPCDNNEQGTATAVGGYRCSGRGGTATAVHNNKKLNKELKCLVNTPQNTQLELIKKQNPLAELLPDKYLLAQTVLNDQCMNDDKSRKMFDERFKDLDVTFEEMLIECVMYYALKPTAQHVSPHRFRSWIKNEHKSKYDEKRSEGEKLWKDLTEDERSLIGDYNYFKKRPELNTMSELKKKEAERLLKILNATKKGEVL
jgi:hypothetical protein